jgi:dipeptidyl aminopeptidase/acylaminoacyl peptidase
MGDWALAALLLAVYLGVSAYAASFVTLPQRDAEQTTPAASGLIYEDVRFAARDDEVQIAGWYVPHAGARRAIVLVHGKDSSRASEFGGRFVELAAALHARGFAVLLIDMRGHGVSGDARFAFGLTERHDIMGATDWLRQQGFAPGSIGVLGVSMGAAAAIGAAAEEPAIGALVADCSYAEIYPLMQQHWTSASGLPELFLPSTIFVGRFIVGHDLTQARPVAEIGMIAAPVLIIHGAEDAFTPVANGRRLAAAAPRAEYWEVAGAPHAGSYLADPQAYVERVATFFAKSLRPAAGIATGAAAQHQLLRPPL